MYIVTPEEILDLRKVVEVPPSNDDLFDAAMEPAIMAASGPEPPTIVPQPIFYLNDHLGNTRVTFRADVCVNGTTVTRYIDHAIDYYPYGKMLRQYFSPSPERYLTTQHERDTETGYDNRGARLYDADVMRFLSVDPLAADYVAWSGYNYVLGNPLVFVDPDGKQAEDIIIRGTVNGKPAEIKWTNGGDLYDLTNGGFYKGNNDYVCKVANDLNQLYYSGDSELVSRIDALDDSKQIHNIAMTDHPEDGNSNTPTSQSDDKNQIPTGSNTKYNPDNETNVRGEKRVARAGLAHELLGHGYDSDQGKTDYTNTSNGIPMYEVDAVNVENRARAAAGDPKKTTYSGKPIPEKLLDDTHKK